MASRISDRQVQCSKRPPVYVLFISSVVSWYQSYAVGKVWKGLEIPGSSYVEPRAR